MELDQLTSVNLSGSSGTGSTTTIPTPEMTVNLASHFLPLSGIKGLSVPYQPPTGPETKLTDFQHSDGSEKMRVPWILV